MRALIAALLLAGAAEIPKGQLVHGVKPAADPQETYTLYLPSSYRPDRKWPILYAFDSRNRGDRFAEVFRAGAERFGILVASAERSSNLNEMEENIRIMRTLWADTHARFSIDDRRVYAVGFSGCSRFVCLLGITAPGSLAGVIGAGGGFPLGHPPSKDIPFPFFGTVGNGDFHYYEMLEAEEKMAAAGMVHRVEVFDGEHEWPPEELAARALAWVELQAMKRGAREKSPELIEALWNEDLARARSLEGKPWVAWRAWSALASDFAGLRDTAEAARKAAEVRASPAFQKDLAERTARDRRDRDFLLRVPRVFQSASHELTPANLSQVLAELQIPQLKKRAQSEDPEEKRSAERLLYALSVQTAIYLPRELSERGQYDRAIFFLHIGGEIYPDNQMIPYRLAMAYARKGNPKRAIEYLRRSSEMEWDDPGDLLREMEREEAFAPLRQEEGYRKLVAELRRKPPAGGG